MKRSVRSAVLLVVSTIVVVATYAAAAGGATTAVKVDVNLKHASVDVERGVLPLDRTMPTSAQFKTLGMSAAAAATVGDPPIGTQRIMLILNDVIGQYQATYFTLRAIGQHTEVWVQNDINFPAGDCRNGVRTTITDPQISGLINEFDTNIYPKESASFSVAPTRDGTNAVLDDIFGLPADSYAGDGDKIVTLVSNVRDDNYYDTNNVNRNTYIAGFFSSQINDYLDRNVMTIDAFDWLHRTGANPPNDPTDDACTSAPARPHLYEGTFAHEYQHLLESYADPDEVNWINEGLSDWAQTLVGYVDTSKSIYDPGFDSHIQCFFGWLSVLTPVNPIPRPACGPENSLTRWNDQGDGEILADYGAAYSMMEMLQNRYGNDFMSALHRGDANGLAGLQEQLDALKGHGHKGKGGHGKVMAQDVLHDWSLMVALDGLIDDGFKVGPGVHKKDITARTLDASINWDNPNAYDTPGAPSNGADYVRLRNATGGYLSGKDIDSLSFSASKNLPAQPVEWTVDPNPPTHAGNPALFSGADDLRDEAIVRPITVPAGAGATLTFDAFWNEELGWDFGFVQISDDGGSTYSSLTCTNTTQDHDPDALPTAVGNLPGFTGFSEGFLSQTCSLADYAGQTILLAFRAFNDPATLGTDPDTDPGFWVDNIKVGGVLISEGLAGWKSFTETKANTVAGFTVWIVSIETKKKNGDITVKPLKLNADFRIKGKVKVGKYIDKKADFVAAIVFYDDPSETSFQYAPYTLTVNGVTQPGGN